MAEVASLPLSKRPRDTQSWEGSTVESAAAIPAQKPGVSGFDPDRNTFTQYYGSRELDAAVLLMTISGFLPASDPRILGTIAAIERELVVDGFVFRYSADFLTHGEQRLENEGAFIMCTYWLAMNYALAGRYADARATFERVGAIANDVGLLAEEYDVTRKMMLGNFPQAFSHVGLIWTARLLSALVGEDPARDAVEHVAERRKDQDHDDQVAQA